MDFWNRILNWFYDHFGREVEYPEAYFFYSDEQFHLNINRDRVNYCKLDDGRVVMYSEADMKNRPFGNWTDYKRLGHGYYDHSERY